MNTLSQWIIYTILTANCVVLVLFQDYIPHWVTGSGLVIVMVMVVWLTNTDQEV